MLKEHEHPEGDQRRLHDRAAATGRRALCWSCMVLFQPRAPLVGGKRTSMSNCPNSRRLFELFWYLTTSYCRVPWLWHLPECRRLATMCARHGRRGPSELALEVFARSERSSDPDPQSEPTADVIEAVSAARRAMALGSTAAAGKPPRPPALRPTFGFLTPSIPRGCAARRARWQRWALPAGHRDHGWG